MYGLNAFALIIFAAANVLAVRLCKCGDKTRKIIVGIFCAALLLLNVVRYALPFILGTKIKIPVEFSTVAYFAVPTAILLSRKKTASWAAYSGLMAGFFYYMTMIAAGGTIYNSYPPYDIYISMFCHGTLYLCGFVVLGTQKCPQKDGIKLIAGVAYVSIRALILRPLVYGTERLFIYELLDGVFIKQLLPQSAMSIVLPVYYVVMVCLVLLSMKLFFTLNRKQYNRFDNIRNSKAELLTTA